MAATYKMTKTTTTTTSSDYGFSSTSAIGHAAVDFVQATENEKRELQGLNERLEAYIGRVKQLEEQNRALVIELDEIRSRLGGEVGQLKYKYSESLVSARKEITEAQDGNISVEVRVNRLQGDIIDFRNRYEETRRELDRERTSWASHISAAKQDLERNKSIYASILEEEKRLYAEQEQLYHELDAVKDELDGAIADRLRFQHQEEALKAELEFLNRVHIKEIEEIRALLTQAPADTRDIFQNELALAIREIKAEYEKIILSTRTELEHIFHSKLSAAQDVVSNRSEIQVQRQVEIQKMSESITTLRARLSELEGKNGHLEREVSGLQIQLRDDQRAYEDELSKRDTALRFMREDCQTLIAELQALLNTKQTLDTEIAIYRKLVESEEHRVGRLVVVSEQESSYTGEVQTKTVFNRHAKGNVSIIDSEASGKYIVLENTSSLDEDIGEYQIRRIIDGRHAFTYVLPAHTTLRGRASLKIYARNSGGVHSPPDSIVFDGEASWGQGVEVQTLLFNRSGVERASYIQRTVSTH